jgi:hypothetical protein
VVPERVRVALAPLAAQIDALNQGIATIDVATTSLVITGRRPLSSSSDKLIETVKGDTKARLPQPESCTAAIRHLA